ncbi:hypothetical protein SFC17_20575 [Bacillus paralicheniformis]|uniref:hypothetical protein n=1 Tax=Bacillus paralicheniformis TaxID=1648923 RepID=UPI0011BE207E|nr:hypothetical protein [Bacillus paralicheniformis]TWK84939.1 hypothetical protein CHCC20333_1263 [Bacillus paralicheniformis]
MSRDVIEYVSFSELDVNDPFFSSLIADYDGFKSWFSRKAALEEKAYILRGNNLLGFLYLKEENEADKTIIPEFIKKRRLKIGTFKIEAHGTVLGERFMSIILRRMIEDDYQECYVTIFDKQKPLIRLFEKFGFSLWGKKKNGELIYIKSLGLNNDIYKDFPRIQTLNKNKFLLSIKPEYHTNLFPYSRLHTEKNHKVEDLSFTNTIEKVYLTKMYGIEKIKSGDLIVIYRMKESGKKAEWSSVATSVCTVLDKKNINQFSSFDEFIKYCGKGTIFSEDELTTFWKTKKFPYIIKMVYNISLPKRIVRHDLIETVGIERERYFGFIPLSDIQFEKILELGEVNESFIIN